MEWEDDVPRRKQTNAEGGGDDGVCDSAAGPDSDSSSSSSSNTDDSNDVISRRILPKLLGASQIVSHPKLPPLPSPDEPLPVGFKLGLTAQQRHFLIKWQRVQKRANKDHRTDFQRGMYILGKENAHEAALTALCGWRDPLGEQIRETMQFIDVGDVKSAHPYGRVTSGSNNGVVSTWSLCCGERLASWQAHHGAVSALLALPNGDVLSASLDGTVRCWALVEDDHTRALNAEMRVANERREARKRRRAEREANLAKLREETERARESYAGVGDFKKVSSSPNAITGLSPASSLSASSSSFTSLPTSSSSRDDLATASESSKSFQITTNGDDNDDEVDSTSKGEVDIEVAPAHTPITIATKSVDFAELDSKAFEELKKEDKVDSSIWDDIISSSSEEEGGADETNINPYALFLLDSITTALPVEPATASSSSSSSNTGSNGATVVNNRSSSTQNASRNNTSGNASAAEAAREGAKWFAKIERLDRSQVTVSDFIPCEPTPYNVESQVRHELEQQAEAKQRTKQLSEERRKERRKLRRAEKKLRRKMDELASASNSSFDSPKSSSSSASSLSSTTSMKSGERSESETESDDGELSMDEEDKIEAEWEKTKFPPEFLKLNISDAIDRLVELMSRQRTQTIAQKQSDMQAQQTPEGNTNNETKQDEPSSDSISQGEADEDSDEQIEVPAPPSIPALDPEGGELDEFDVELQVQAQAARQDAYDEKLMTLMQNSYLSLIAAFDPKSAKALEKKIEDQRRKMNVNDSSDTQSHQSGNTAGSASVGSEQKSATIESSSASSSASSSSSKDSPINLEEVADKLKVQGHHFIFPAVHLVNELSMPSDFGPVRCMKREGAILFVGGDGGLCVFDMRTGNLVHRLLEGEEHCDYGRVTALCPIGGLIALGLAPRFKEPASKFFPDDYPFGATEEAQVRTDATATTTGSSITSTSSSSSTRSSSVRCRVEMFNWQTGERYYTLYSGRWPVRSLALRLPVRPLTEPPELLDKYPSAIPRDWNRVLKASYEIEVKYQRTATLICAFNDTQQFGRTKVWHWDLHSGTPQAPQLEPHLPTKETMASPHGNTNVLILRREVRR